MRTTIVLAMAACLAAASPQVAPAQPGPAAQAPLSAEAYAARADAMLKTLTAAERFSGAVLVAKDGKPVFRRAYGLANREWNIPAAPDTVYRLGSITKQFTAAAILQLAEQGKLSLDDPISKYYAAPDAWSAITLKHLLTHTSGIPSYTAIPGFFAGGQSRTDMTPEQIVGLTRDKPLEFPPGTKYNYDNTGYVLLGIVIEKASGQRYATYLREHFFQPLGLKNTGFEEAPQILPRRAAGYERVGERVINTPYLSMTLPHAAGSLYSTVDDLLTWDRALMAGKVISPASVTAMFTDYGNRYGYGQGIGTASGRRYWSHNGGINGFTTVLGRFPDDGVTVVVLANLTASQPGRVANRLAELWFNPAAVTGPIGAPTTAELDRYVGRYKVSETSTLQVTREGARLFAQSGDGPKAEVSRELGRTFFGPAPIGYLEFADGPKAPEITIFRGGPAVKARRVE